jgi:thiamine-monophosphate kinase
MKEFDIINKFFKKLVINPNSSENLNNDTANIKIPNDQKLIISKDIIAENCHFKKEYGGYKIAYKLLASNLSDLASSGAKPHSFMLGFTKNSQIDENFIELFCQALLELSKKYNLSLIGGDTISSKSDLFFSITIFGTITKEYPLARNKAKAGDLIFISENIGDSYLGLQILENKLQITDPNIKNYFLDKHFYPIPKIDLAINLLEKNLSQSAIDISDGLFSDLSHICQNSNLESHIFLEKIPISKEAQNLNINILELCSGGEDYELLFTAKKEDKKEIEKLSKDLNIKITEIGYFTKNKNSKIKLFDQNNKEIPIQKYGYEH